MLLTITYTGQNTTDLGYLLYKNPYRPQEFNLSFGKVYVFYPEISDERTTVALLLDIDPIDLVRGKPGSGSNSGSNTSTTGGGLFDYVNDRPYVSSSFMSTAISKVFNTAMLGRADDRQELADSQLDLTATVTMLPCRGERSKLDSVFGPLGYEVSYQEFISDERFPQWGESDYVNLTISARVRLRDLLKHLYVLIPVFDRQKHYWIGNDEVDKLLRLGEGWLNDHPERAYITSRYLKRRRSLINQAFERLAEDESTEEEPAEEGAQAIDSESATAPTPASAPAHPPTPNLNTQRLESVVAELKTAGAHRIIDIGCGEGNLIRLLIQDSQFTAITGVDVSHVALKRASQRLRLERAGDAQRERVQLLQGSLNYKDDRFAGYDAACVIEVIEHLDKSRLTAFERVLFEFAKPPVVIITTPNREYNSKYANLAASELRHGDHRFEFTRAEFQQWASGAAERNGYSVEYKDIGEADENCGAATQMGVFRLCV
ncbi:MAG: 3' terminal RNA ribose 2'-O-methyltransferase Hen1 [Coriobacteriia bacterium]|nr:3' terminal RNA ribose 2'-O-methyltransferase Hen1 [Coriobacteriia bacterium]